MPLTPTLTSTSVVENPLVTLRDSLGLLQRELAKQMGVTKTTVQFAEKGCYSDIPPCYNADLQTRRHYQLFREAKRCRNFEKTNFPPEITNLPALLAHLDLTPFQFAERICVQPAEIFKLLNRPERSNVVPANLIQAFMQIGVPMQWILNFQKGQQ